MTSPTHERVRPCTDLQAALDEELQIPGTRLLSIFPADAPRIATIEREGEWTRLDASPGAIAGEVARTLRSPGSNRTSSTFPSRTAWAPGPGVARA